MSKTRFAISYFILVAIGVLIDYQVFDLFRQLFQFLPFETDALGRVVAIILFLVTLFFAFILAFILNVFLELFDH